MITRVLEFGGNDCDFDWKSVSDDPEASHICKTPLETFKQKYARMLETIKRFGRQAGGAESAADRLGTLFPLDQPKSVAVAHPALSERGRLHRRWQEMFNIAAVQVASAAGVPGHRHPQRISRAAGFPQLSLRGRHPPQRSRTKADLRRHPPPAPERNIKYRRRKPTSGLLRRFCFENACRPEKPRCGTSPQPERFGRFLYSEQRCQKGLDFCQRCFCSYSTICKRGSQQNLLTFPFPF